MLNNIIAMNNKRNKKNPNANRGTYHKKRVPKPLAPSIASVRTNNEINVKTGYRIINLHSLQLHLQRVTNHVAAYLPGLH